MTFSEQFERRHLLGPNGLTILRAVAALFLPFLILSHSPTLHITASVIFAFAALTDLADGMLARRYALETKVGRFIDPLADKMLTLGMLMAFSKLGYYSAWLLAPIFFREILITFFRFGWILEGVSAGAERMGKVKQGFLIACLSSSLIYRHARDFQFLQSAAAPFRFLMLASLLGSLVLCIISGISFSRNHRELFKTPFFAKYVSALGVGLLKPAPGTWGSALALIFIALTAWNSWLYAGSFLFLAWAGFWAFPRLAEGGKDPGFVVVDEVCGMYVTLMGFSLQPLTLLLGFLFFRFFDIVKPFPLRYLETLPGFWGVLLDDLGAGLYAWGLLHLVLRLGVFPL